MRGGLKQEFKKRIQNLAGRREAIRSVREVRSEVDRLHLRLDVFRRRVILGTLATRPECMHDPAKSFCNRVHRYTERRATPAA